MNKQLKKELILIGIGIILAILVGRYSSDLPPILDDRLPETHTERVK
jgi:hypothetical protein